VRDRFGSDPRFVFARRVITRREDGTEDHDTATIDEFDRLAGQGAFLLSWRANGLAYGLPGVLRRDLDQGRIVIANVSRAVLPDVRRFGRSFVVHVTADPAILAARLSARAREDAEAQQARLARALDQASVEADLTIDNSADLAASIDALEHALKALKVSAPEFARS